MKQFEKVIDHVERLFIHGQLNVGDKLPSIRELAKALSLSCASVIKAYQQLESEHKVYVIPKSGYYWMDRPQRQADETSLIDFSRMYPDPQLVPFNEFQHCLNQAIHLYKRDLFGYGDAQGLHTLINALVPHLSDRQIFCSAGQIAITSGSQQALSLLSAMDFGNGRKAILMEQPTYSVFQSAAALYNLPVTTIHRTTDGLDFRALETAMQSGLYKCFYTMPRCHNPLATSLSEKDKQHLVSLAAKYNVYLIEDDYLADLTTDSRSLPLHYYDTTDRVIYVKSFSKAFLPGIRLGLVVLPAALMPSFLTYKRVHDLNTAVLSQGALELFLSSGLYDRHTQKSQKVYSKKCQLAAQLLKGPFASDIDLHVPHSGFLAWIGFPETYPFEAFLTALNEKNIQVVAHRFQHPVNPLKSQDSWRPWGIRICFASATETDMKKGLSALAQLIREHDPNR